MNSGEQNKGRIGARFCPSPRTYVPFTSPIRTSTHVIDGLHVVQRVDVKLEPVDTAPHHSPLSSMRPTRSALPSPLMSPMWTATHVTAVLHVAQSCVLKLVPVDTPAHH